VIEELIPSAWHHVERYANNPIEADHSRLKHRLRPMRGLQTDRTAQVIIGGHAFMQNLRRGHYELDSTPHQRCESRLPSPNSRWRSNPPTETVHRVNRSDNATAPPRTRDSC